MDKVGRDVAPPISSSHTISTTPWTNIKDDPLKMCSFTTEKLTNYFVYCKDRDGLERQDWKSLNSGGYRLFAEGHVQDVMMKINNDDCLIKANVLPEMKKDKKYAVSSTINQQTNDVIAAACSCPAGCGPQGSCKHIAALCFCIESFVRARDVSFDLGEEACTAALQKWNQPRKRRLDPKKADEISFRIPVPSYAEKEKKRSERKAYDPRPLTMRNTMQAELEEFRDELKELPNGTGFSQLLHMPCDTSPTEITSQLPLIPRSVQCRMKAKLSSTPLPPSFHVLQELGQEFIDGITPNSQQKSEIEKATRMQANCVRWHEERYCRLTASNFGAVVKRRSAHTNLATSILSSKMLLHVRAIKWGRDHEQIALAQYSSEISKLHPNLALQTAGFCIGQSGYLGASPDGVLIDVKTGVVHGIIEIKCPYSAAKLTVREACGQCTEFYCNLDDIDQISLDSNHVYYYQVLGTMAITAASFCDFIVWTPKSMEIINIKFDEQRWVHIKPVLERFYIHHMIPCILY